MFLLHPAMLCRSSKSLLLLSLLRQNPKPFLFELLFFNYRLQLKIGLHILLITKPCKSRRKISYIIEFLRAGPFRVSFHLSCSMRNSLMPFFLLIPIPESSNIIYAHSVETLARPEE